ncbi:MAG: DNA polymerase I [Vicingaceae bacterium]
MKEDKRLFLLDAYALIFRAYYAFIKNPRMNSEGLNTSAMFGFTNSLLDIINREKPTHLAVCFDFPAKTVRNEIYSEYKANRDATPEDIKTAVPYIKKIIEAFRIPILEAEGYEADDVIGTLAKKAEKNGYVTYMVTPDKDFGQLVSPNIKIYKPAKAGNGPEVMGPEEVCAQWGIERPEQVIDILSMMGDAVDNIPGLPGVGAKTAANLIKDYGSLEGLYEHTDELKGKLKERVEENKDQAFMSKVLATILLDAPVDFDPSSLVIEEPDKDALKELFVQLEFRNLAAKILGEEVSMAKVSEIPKTESNGQYDLFSDDQKKDDSENIQAVDQHANSIENSPHDYQLVDDKKKLDDLISKLKAADKFCFDTETTSINALEARLLGIAFSIEKGRAYYVPAPEKKEDIEKFLESFRPVLESGNVLKIGHNLKYDILVLRKYRLRVAQPYFDTMLAHYVLYPDVRRRSMDALAEVYLGYSAVSIESLIGKKGKEQKNMSDLRPDEISDYACEDADITLQLFQYFSPLIEENNSSDLMEKIELPLIEVLSDMEEEGICIDKEFLADLSKQLQTDIVSVQKRIHEMAGIDFNIASPRQVGEVLFDHLKIYDKAKKTKSGQYATGEEILSKLTDKHEIVGLILDFRELVKLKNTYVDVLPTMVMEHDGRIHTTFNQWVAATGRLSSDNPNLQNIPIKTTRGQEVRKAFIPRNSEFSLLSSDYSQVELRILASLSKDEGMIEAFRNGEDIHAATAAKVFGVKQADVDREMRTKAKAVNFGIAYGQGAFGLSQNLNISRSEAKDIIDQYFEKFSGIRSYMSGVVEMAREKGYVETIMGRKRHLPTINSANHVVRSQAERFAINAPIQGSAADIIKIAMIDLHRAMRKEKMRSKMLLQVHDELVFDAHMSELEGLKNLVKDHMENAVKLEVPLIVEMNAADNWLEAH